MASKGNEEKQEFDKDRKHIIEFGETPRKLRKILPKYSHEGITQELTQSYHEYDNPNYHRGMFINANSIESRVHNYREMQTLLEKLTKEYPSDVSMFSAGQSEGYGSDENALDVWGIQILPTGEPEKTIFFVAGHHYDEYSGPETVYLVAKYMLESYHKGNEGVKTLRKNCNSERSFTKQASFSFHILKSQDNHPMKAIRVSIHSYRNQNMAYQTHCRHTDLVTLTCWMDKNTIRCFSQILTYSVVSDVPGLPWAFPEEDL